MAGPIDVSLHLWREDLSVPTQTLELIYIIIPLVSHVLMLMWAGYMLTRFILTHFQCQSTDVRVVLTDFTSGVKQCFQRRQSQYQELN